MKCLICGTLVSQQRKFCSIACVAVRNRRAGAARNGRGHPRSCMACGRDFIPGCTRQRACSRSCGQLIRSPKRTRVPLTHPARWFGATTLVAYAACMWCDRTIVVPPTRDKRYCSDRCNGRMKRARRASRECATPEWQTWTWGAFMKMAAKFDWRCAYCGVRPDRLDPDHVVPIAQGGKNTLANLLPSCMPCNSDKRDLSLMDWQADRLRRGLVAVATTWADGDERYAHLITVTPLGRLA